MSTTTSTTTTSNTQNCNFVWEPLPTPSVAIVGSNEGDESEQERFPVHRIYCVGRNYADHVVEMGGDPDRSSPTFFTKPADAIVSSGSQIPYPLHTSNLHYEVELVVCIGQPPPKSSMTSNDTGARSPIPASEANGHIFGYAVGIDLTRRDLQAAAKASGNPWDSAKAFDQSAPIGAITRVSRKEEDGCSLTLLSANARIKLSANGEVKQSGRLNQMIWSVPEIIEQLSNQFHLQPGDLIFTGTPSGVGPIVAGDHVHASIDGLQDFDLWIT